MSFAFNNPVVLPSLMQNCVNLPDSQRIALYGLFNRIIGKLPEVEVNFVMDYLIRFGMFLERNKLVKEKKNDLTAVKSLLDKKPILGVG